MEQEKQKSPKIKLPENSEMVQRLQDKLGDYKQRLEYEESEIDPYKAPETVFSMLVDTRYKIAVLEKLLNDGEVNTFELSKELNDQDGRLDTQAFNNACAVIDDYCKTGGKNVRGGTGL